MSIDDQFIIDYFFINDKININKIKHYNNIDNKTNLDIYNYLINRYKDNPKKISFTEILNRIKFNIEIRPICKTCGNPVKFIGNKNKGLYTKYCCSHCSNINKEKILKERETKEKKYGDKNFNNRSKFHQTCLIKYGKYSYTNREKAIETYLKRYGYQTPFNDKTIQETIKQTIKTKYNVNNISKLDWVKKLKEQTSLDKYGVCYYNQSKEGRINLSKKLSSKETQLKIHITKSKHGTYTKSKLEDQSYELLKEKYPDVIRQYRSDIYPFNCDFYIPSLDLYIECHYFWMHGGKLYEGTNEDNKLLDKWKEKSYKDIYQRAINNWTQYDIKKYNIAKENNLNYLMFYNIEQLKQFLKEG